MEMKEHAIYKTCKEHDPEKYVAIASQSSGYAKLCCYAVKKLNENEIVTSYENICVALWLMFPKYEKFHLKGFDDMPDTDYMEKIIKLRSTPTQQDYLTGGNVGFDKNIQNPWQLTRKGQVYAEEAGNIFSGKAVAPEKRESTVKKTPNAFNNTFSKLCRLLASCLAACCCCSRGRLKTMQRLKRANNTFCNAYKVWHSDY